MAKTSEKIRARHRYLDKMRKLGTPVMIPVTDRMLRHLALVRPSKNLKEISAECGITRFRLSKIANRETRTIDRWDAARLMAVLPKETYIPAENRRVGSMRILQGLTLAGYTSQTIAEGLGTTTHGCVKQYRQGKQIPGHEVYRSLVALAQKWEILSPADVGQDEAHTLRLRSYTQKRDYVPLSAWDYDTVSDPKAKADLTGRCGTVAGFEAHRRDGIPFYKACLCRAAHNQQQYNKHHPGEELPIEEFLIDRRSVRKARTRAPEEE